MEPSASPVLSQGQSIQDEVRSLALSAASSSTPEAEQFLLSDQEQKTFAHAEIFSV